MSWRRLAGAAATLALAACQAPHQDVTWFGLRIDAKGTPGEMARDRARWPDAASVPFPPAPQRQQQAAAPRKDEPRELVMRRGGEDGTCAVTRAALKLAGNTDAPLFLPIDMTAPTPGMQAMAARRVLGPSAGSVPATNPIEVRVAYAFEYHSELNGQHGCTSRQFVQKLDATIHKERGLVGITDGTLGDHTAFAPDTDESYKGDTRTGLRIVRNAVLYEGTPDVIHWLDAPGANSIRAPAFAAMADVVITLLKSVTWNSDGATGWACLSGHAAVIDHATGQPMDAQAARQLLDRVAPNGGDSAPDALKRAAETIGLPPARGGFRGTVNPEARDLGCYPL